jgi:hypothetical protein
VGRTGQSIDCSRDYFDEHVLPDLRVVPQGPQGARPRRRNREVARSRGGAHASLTEELGNGFKYVAEADTG